MRMLYEYGEPLVKSLNVIERGPKITNTGLVFANGHPIFKVEYPEPIGFIHFPEDDSEEKEIQVS